MKYDFTAIEAKWHKIWDEKQLYAARTGSDAKKFYALAEFPYPSGAGLHVGHARPYTAMDVIARKHRMQGENVLFPMGYDAFGLPTENYAIKNHIHPASTGTVRSTRRTQSISSGRSGSSCSSIRTALPTRPRCP